MCQAPHKALQVLSRLTPHQPHETGNPTLQRRLPRLGEVNQHAQSQVHSLKRSSSLPHSATPRGVRRGTRLCENGCASRQDLFSKIANVTLEVTQLNTGSQGNSEVSSLQVVPLGGVRFQRRCSEEGEEGRNQESEL